MISSYEEYMLKSHLLSKMYLQQYCSAGLNIAKNTNSSDKPSKGEAHNIQTVHFTDLISAEKSSKASEAGEGRKVRRREGGETPLDLSTRTLEHHQALKEHLYPHNFPFASLQQMLLQSASQEGKAQLGAKKADTPTLTPATSEPADRETSKELSYVCPICGQMFGLHDRYNICILGPQLWTSHTLTCSFTQAKTLYYISTGKFELLNFNNFPLNIQHKLVIASHQPSHIQPKVDNLMFSDLPSTWRADTSPNPQKTQQR